MKIEKNKLRKAADVAKTKANEAKAVKDTPTLDGLMMKIDALEARISALEA